MRLETQEGRAAEDPSEDQIRQAIEGIGRESGGFVILTGRETPLEYVQTSGDEKGFVVEWHQGDRHLRATDETMTLDAAVALFQAYGRGDEAWSGMARWEDVTSEARGPRWQIVVLIGVATAALAALILYYSFK
jgi:hypothetical protein